MDLQERLAGLIAEWRDPAKHDKLDDPIYEVCAEQLERLAAESSREAAAVKVQPHVSLRQKEVETVIHSFRTSTNPHFDWKEHYAKITSALNRILRDKQAALAAAPPRSNE